MFKVNKGGDVNGSEDAVMGRPPIQPAKMRIEDVKLEKQRLMTEKEARPAGRELVFNSVLE